MNTKSVLFICYGHPFGGAEIYQGRLKVLIEDKCSVFALCGSPQLATYLRECGVSVIDYLPRFRPGMLWNLEYLLACGLSLPYLRWKYGINVFWINGFREAFLIPWARLVGCKVVATMHMTLSVTRSQVFYPYLILLAHRIVCVSQTVALSLPSFVPKAMVNIIHNWVVADVQPGYQVSAQPGRFRILVVARLVRYKGVATVIAAVRRLGNLLPRTRISLAVVGDGESRSELEAQALGLDVTFTGFLDDPSAMYDDADLYIHPTLGPEGSSLSTIEAMSFGLPCLISDIDVNVEVSGESRYARLYRAGDVEDLSRSLAELAGHPDSLYDLSERALEGVREQYSSEIAARRYRELIAGL